MLVWAAGWCPADPQDRLGAEPVDGREVPGVGGVWTVGYRERLVRTVRGGERESVTVIGSCPVSDHELRSGLGAAAAARWERLGMLPGSWVMVVALGSRTVVFGDLAGVTRVYFARLPRGVLWASAATPLAAFVGGGPRLEVLALDMAISGIDLYGGEVPLEDVDAVEPGWLLSVVGGLIRRERWHEPARVESFAQAVAGIRGALMDGVRGLHEQADGLTSDASGLDSSILARLAVESGELDVFTYADDRRSADVWYTRQLIEACPGLRHHVVARDQRVRAALLARHAELSGHITVPDESVLHYADLGDLDRLPQTDLPSISQLVLGPNRRILGLAARAGSSDHMIGVGADQVLSARLAKLAPLLSSHPGQTVREAFQFARRRRLSRLKVTHAVWRLARTSYPESLAETARALRAGHLAEVQQRDDWRRQLAWCTLTWAARCLTPDAACELSARLAGLADHAPADLDPESTHGWQEVRRLAADLAGCRSLAAEHGIELQAPYLFAQVLNHALGLAGHLREPAGTSKPLTRHGMADVLPPALTSRTAKSTFVNTDRLGIREHQAEVGRLVADSALVTSGIMRPDAVRAAASRAIGGLGGQALSIDPLLAADIWLKQLRLNPADWWKEEPCTQPHRA